MNIVDEAVGAAAAARLDGGEEKQLQAAAAHWHMLKQKKKDHVAKLGGEDGLQKLKASVGGDCPPNSLAVIARAASNAASSILQVDIHARTYAQDRCKLPIGCGQAPSQCFEFEHAALPSHRAGSGYGLACCR
jgi:hypothetical protein